MKSHQPMILQKGIGAGSISRDGKTKTEGVGRDGEDEIKKDADAGEREADPRHPFWMLAAMSPETDCGVS